MKPLLITMAVLLPTVGFLVMTFGYRGEESLGAPTPKLTPEEQLVADVDAFEASHKASNIRYAEVPPTVKGVYTYWVNEYLSEGGIGYELVILRTNGDGSQDVKQVATGPETALRSFEWTPYDPNPFAP